MNKSSTGLEENIAGLLCYGWFLGIIFFFIEKESKFVKFHAMQSILVWIPVTVVGWITGMIGSSLYRSWVTSNPMRAWSGGFGVHSLFNGLSTILWWGGGLLTLFLMFKAYNNEEFKLPIIGDIAEQQANK